MAFIFRNLGDLLWTFEGNYYLDSRPTSTLQLILTLSIRSRSFGPSNHDASRSRKSQSDFWRVNASGDLQSSLVQANAFQQNCESAIRPQVIKHGFHLKQDENKVVCFVTLA